MSPENLDVIHGVLTKTYYMSLGIAVGSPNSLVISIAVAMMVMCLIGSTYIEGKFQPGK